MRNRSTYVARARAPPRDRSNRLTRPRRGWPGSRWPRPTSRARRRAAADPRAHTRCPARIASDGEAIRARRPATRISPASAGVRPKRISASCVRPDPTRPARPRISPRATESDTSCTPVARFETPRSSSATSPRGTSRFGKTADELAADHQPDQLRAVDVAGRPGPDRLAVAQDRDAIGDREHFLQPVGDIDDADALARAARAMTSNRPCTSRSLSAAVGSSMIRIRASVPIALAISTTCCSGIVSVSASRSGSSAAPTRARSSVDCAPPRRPVDAAPGVAALERERDVLGDREVGKKRRLLVDRRDAERARRVRIEIAHRSAADGNRPGVGASRRRS